MCLYKRKKKKRDRESGHAEGNAKRNRGWSYALTAKEHPEPTGDAKERKNSSLEHADKYASANTSVRECISLILSHQVCGDWL